MVPIHSASPSVGAKDHGGVPKGDEHVPHRDRAAGRVESARQGSASTTAPVAVAARRGGRGNRTIPDYDRAKVNLRKIYTGFPTTLYCGCRYRASNQRAERSRCGYDRSMVVNWEHVVPASHLGNHRPSWRGDDPRCRRARVEGRSCARLIDKDFNLREADLYNLYPSLMDLNRARGSLKPGEVSGESRRFGSCDFEIGGRRVEPTPAVRGDIARTYFYMAEAYPDADFLRSSLKRLLQRWDRADPVDAAECERARKIAAVQGNQNRFVRAPCAAKGL